jgi:hypothetical protein
LGVAQRGTLLYRSTVCCKLSAAAFIPASAICVLSTRDHVEDPEQHGYTLFGPSLRSKRHTGIFRKAGVEIFQVDGVNSRVELEGVDIGVKRIEEIASEPSSFLFVKAKSAPQIGKGRRLD